MSALEVTRWKPGRGQFVSLASRSDSLSALWIHFRRLVASVMLVAVASFVLHSGAMAGFHHHGPGSTECAETAAGHVHQAAQEHDERAAQVQGDGKVHHHAPADHAHADLTGDGATDDRQAPTGDTCCANVCAVALTALTPSAISAPLSVTAALPPVSHDGVSTHLDRLKRPPRTPCIA
jgi:hypothetical protein